MENTNQGNFDSFLDDEAQDGASYVKPNIEHKLSKDKRQICRDIALGIKEYGISQRQRLYLIYLLTLELENNDLMKKITQAIGDHREEVELSRTDTMVQEQTPQLILPDGYGNH